jgi:hypothetical protein
MDYFYKVDPVTQKKEINKGNVVKFVSTGFVVIGIVIALFFLIAYLTSPEWWREYISKTSSLFSSPEKGMSKQIMQIKPLDTNKEPFNNDLPTPQVDLTAGVDANGVSESNNDYSDIIAGQALEKGVFDQHKAYIKEKNKVTNTASRNPARSDSQDLMPFVGLRRIQYQVKGKDMVDSTARQVPSVVDADQLGKPNNLRWD